MNLRTQQKYAKEGEKKNPYTREQEYEREL